MMRWMVEGGVYTDTDWQELVPGTAESYGPFDSWDEAVNWWKRGMFSPKLDIAGHRLFIKEIEDEEAMD